MHNNGFSLIEVLLSVVIVSIGVLGAASMQLASLRTAQQSQYQTTALQLAAEMADQVRAQQRLSNSNEPLNIYLGLDYKADQEPTPAAQCISIDANCAPADLAKFNIHEWEQRIKATLPKGRVVICRDSNPWDNATGKYKWECGSGGTVDQIVVKLGWNEKKANGTDENQGSDKQLPIVALLVGG